MDKAVSRKRLWLIIYSTQWTLSPCWSQPAHSLHNRDWRKSWNKNFLPLAQFVVILALISSSPGKNTWRKTRVHWPSTHSSCNRKCTCCSQGLDKVQQMSKQTSISTKLSARWVERRKKWLVGQLSSNTQTQSSIVFNFYLHEWLQRLRLSARRPPKGGGIFSWRKITKKKINK